MKESVKNYKRIVVKIGSSLFCSEKAGLNTILFNNIASQIISLINAGKEVVVVSSGAIALGMRILGLKIRPKELSFLQASAAIGQNALMDNYSEAFKKGNLICAQVLLTWDDFDNRKRYLNAKNTILRLLKLKSIPIINENDTVSTDEIRFGDNDQLSAQVANLISADLLIMLSDVDGLLGPDKKVIPVIDKITPELKSLAGSTNKQTSIGGMISKLQAAAIVSGSAISCVITNGRRNNVIIETVNNIGSSGTLFIPGEGHLAEKKRWIAFGTKSRGRIIIDDGAKNALLNKKSLLSVGVSALEGNFDADNIISIVDKQGNEFARGKTMLSSRQLDKVKGMRTDKEVVHCDNIVIL